MIDISGDALLTPHAFTASTLTKYVPGASVPATVVAAPTFPLNKLLSPGDVPARTTYDVAPAVGLQDNVTAVPAFRKFTPTGVAGAAHPPRMTTASFDAGPVPAALIPRTRT